MSVKLGKFFNRKREQFHPHDSWINFHKTCQFSTENEEKIIKKIKYCEIVKSVKWNSQLKRSERGEKSSNIPEAIEIPVTFPYLPSTISGPSLWFRIQSKQEWSSITTEHIQSIHDYLSRSNQTDRSLLSPRVDVMLQSESFSACCF